MLHKLKLAPFFFIAGVVASFGVQAASVDLKVTGRILPVACAIALPGGGKADFGTMGGVLSSGASFELGSRDVAFSIDCASFAGVAIKFVDNKVDTIDTASTKKDKRYLFGLGTSGGKKNGSYAIVLKDLADEVGNKMIPVVSSDGSAYTKSAEGWVQNGGALMSFSGAGTAPSAIKHLKGTLSVYAYVGPAVDVKNEVDLDGSATLELVYL